MPLGNAARPEVGRLEDGRASKPAHVSAEGALALRERCLARAKNHRLRSRFLLEAAHDADEMAWDALEAYEKALNELMEVTEPTEGTHASQREGTVPATQGQERGAPPATATANNKNKEPRPKSLCPRHFCFPIVHILFMVSIIAVFFPQKLGLSNQIEGADAAQRLQFLALPAA